MKCECGKHPVAYLLDSWTITDEPRKICVVCADKMITALGSKIIKDTLNLREIVRDDKGY